MIMRYTVLRILQYKQISSKQVEKLLFSRYKVIDETTRSLLENMSWKILSEIQNLLQTDYEILCILH